MTKTKVWQCTGCERGPCNLFTDEEAASVAFMCDYDPENCHWKESTRYQITELPAIWVVNIPWGEINKTNIEGAFYLREYDGEEITDLTFDFHGTGMVMHEESEVAFPPEWLTQKQPETSEHLQKRIDSILYTAKQEDHFHPWRIKRIIKIANGES